MQFSTFLWKIQNKMSSQYKRNVIHEREGVASFHVACKQAVGISGGLDV